MGAAAEGNHKTRKGKFFFLY